MVSVAKLTADLSVNSSAFEAGLRRASGTLGQFSSNLSNSMGKNARQFTQFNSSLSTTQGALRAVKSEIISLGSVAAGALSIQKVIKYSDTWKQLEGRLKIVSDTAGDVAVAQDKLFDIAQRTKQPLESVTNLYTRLNMALGENKRGLYDVAGITETFSKALAVTGEGAAQSSSAILQFSQAISSDFKASAQEINSLLDSAPRLALAIQKSFGDGSKSLKKLAEDGELSTEGVLRALEPLAAQARQIGNEFGNMQITVGQALTQLDNALLQYIGRTDAIKSGTSSLALGISALAENFGLVATAATTIAAVFTGRLLGALGRSAIAWAANTAEVYAYQLALARLSGVTAGVATGLLAASRAAGLLRVALAFVGGPIGAAFLAVGAAVYYLANAQTAAEKTAESWGVKASRLAEINGLLAAGSDRHSAALAKERDQIILTALAENKATQAKLASLEALQKKGGLGLAAGNVNANIKTTQDELTAQSAALGKMGDELQAEINRQNRPSPTPTGVGPSKSEQKAIKNAEQLIRSLEKQNQELALKNSLMGQGDAVLEKAQLRQEVENQIIDQKIKLTKEQRAQVDQYVQSIESQTDASERLASKQEMIVDVTDRLSSSLLRGVTSWDQIKDAALDALGSMIEYYIKLNTVQSAGGGSSGGFLSSAIGALGNFFSGTGAHVSAGGLPLPAPSKPSHATGMARVPYDMTANIHKNEAVLTSDEAAAWRAGGGKGGGDNYTINAQGAEAGVEMKLRNVMNELLALKKSVPAIALNAVAGANKRDPRFLNV